MKDVLVEVTKENEMMSEGTVAQAGKRRREQSEMKGLVKCRRQAE
jgi:hypothetical protein